MAQPNNPHFESGGHDYTSPPETLTSPMHVPEAVRARVAEAEAAEAANAAVPEALALEALEQVIDPAQEAEINNELNQAHTDIGDIDAALEAAETAAEAQPEAAPQNSQEATDAEPAAVTSAAPVTAPSRKTKRGTKKANTQTDPKPDSESHDSYEARTQAAGNWQLAYKPRYEESPGLYKDLMTREDMDTLRATFRSEKNIDELLESGTPTAEMVKQRIARSREFVAETFPLPENVTTRAEAQELVDTVFKQRLAFDMMMLSDATYAAKMDQIHSYEAPEPGLDAETIAAVEAAFPMPEAEQAAAVVTAPEQTIENATAVVADGSEASVASDAETIAAVEATPVADTQDTAAVPAEAPRVIGQHQVSLEGLGGETTNADSTPGREGVGENQVDTSALDAVDTTTGETNEAPTTGIDAQQATSETLADQLALLEDELATLSATRQAQLWTKESRNTEQQYLETQDMYDLAVARANMHNVQQFMAANPEATALDQRSQLVTMALSNEERFRGNSVDRLRSSRFSRVLNWLNNPADSRAKRIGKRAVVGVGVGLVAGVIGVATGGVGVGAVVGAGAGAIAGSRAAVTGLRVFANRETAQGRGMNRSINTPEFRAQLHRALEESQEQNDGVLDLSRSVQSLQSALRERREADTRNEQSKRRKSAAYAVGGAAIGAVAGAAIGELADRGLDMITGSGTADAAQAPAGPNQPPQVVTPEATPVPTPAVAHNIYSADAVQTHYNEGLFESFGDITGNQNISSANLNNIIQEVGPQLEAKGLAYRMNDGLWGWNSTANLDQGSMDLIFNTAQKYGVPTNVRAA